MSYQCVGCRVVVEKRKKLHRLLPICEPCLLAVKAVAHITGVDLNKAGVLVDELKETEEKMRLRRKSQGASFSGVGLFMKFRWYATELGPDSNLTAKAWVEYRRVIANAR